MDIQKVTEKLEQHTAELKELAGVDIVQLTLVNNEDKRVFLINGNEEIEFSDFASGIFSLITNLGANLKVREIKKELDKQKKND